MENTTKEFLLHAADQTSHRFLTKYWWSGRLKGQQQVSAVYLQWIVLGAGVLAVEFEAKNKNLDVFEFDVPIRTGLKAQQEINQAFKFINIFKIRIF